MAKHTKSETAQQAPLPYSDTTNAMTFVRHHGTDLRYCYPWKTWLIWTGTHWERDTSGRVMRRGKQTVRRLAGRVATMADDTAVKALLAHVKHSLSTSALRAMIDNAQSEPGIPVQPEELDTKPWLLNCANGTLDLQTGIKRPHARTDLLTQCLDVAYEPDAVCPTWEAFLARILAENANLIAFLQRAIGYALTGETREQCFFLLHGTGANGKSTFLDTLHTLLGPYAQSTTTSTLLAKDTHGHESTNDLARLQGARLITATEIGDGRRLDEERIKRLTGQDVITARFLYEENFDFRPAFKLFVACNHLPTIRGTDHAIWRRVHRVPFTVTIPDAEQDRTLLQKLRRELPGILAWAVRGCLAWHQHGLAVPQEVTQATATYQTTMDVVARFLEECCLIDQANTSLRTRAGDLYKAYQAWCEASGEHHITLTKFGEDLDNKKFPKAKSNGVWRLGVGLLDPRIRSQTADSEPEARHGTPGTPPGTLATSESEAGVVNGTPGRLGRLTPENPIRENLSKNSRELPSKCSSVPKPSLLPGDTCRYCHKEYPAGSLVKEVCATCAVLWRTA